MPTSNLSYSPPPGDLKTSLPSLSVFCACCRRCLVITEQQGVDKRRRGRFWESSEIAVTEHLYRLTDRDRPLVPEDAIAVLRLASANGLVFHLISHPWCKSLARDPPCRLSALPLTEKLGVEVLQQSQHLAARAQRAAAVANSDKDRLHGGSRWTQTT
jgi:hypothetical protein